MKQIDLDQPLDKPFGGFWMKAAYRVPAKEFPLATRFRPRSRRPTRRSPRSW